MAERLRIPPDDAHNQALVSNAHPSDWRDPEPAERYDLVVVGAGTAGLVSAAGAAGLGARVALVERELMGGDCLNVGCVPSKALIRAARAAADVRDAGNYGVRVQGEAKVDFGAVMERVRRLRAAISPNDSAKRFKSLGVDVFLGSGAFSGPDSVSVGGKTLRFKKAVIATGARAAIPSVPGLKEAGCLTNETVFNLTELPKRLSVLGAGPIGCELAQAFQRLGSEVTLIAKGDHILPREDPEAAAAVEAAFDLDGVRIVRNAGLLSVEKAGGAKRLRLESAGKALEVGADEILVAVGRAPNVEGLGLEAAGVRFDPKGGVAVDDFLRTTNPRVYAAGDACLKYKFTHAADASARIVIQNALFFGRKRAGSLIVPWCTYTDPEVAHVGLYEREAAALGRRVQSLKLPMGEVDRAVLDGEGSGFLKLLMKEGSGRILGATLVARHAGEMISELTLAMTGGLGLGTIAATIHPYPTQAEAFKRAGDAFNRGRLTPGVRGLLKFIATRLSR